MISMLKAGLKGTLMRLFPETMIQIVSARARAHSHRLVQAWGCADLNTKLIARLGSRVVQGPFAGLVLSPETSREHLAPYLLGTYEREIHPAWERILKGRYTQIVDIGSKFGFYAVALARRFAGVPVLAFDTDPWARKATREMAAANGVNVEVLGFCRPQWLHDHLQAGAFVLSDCEGYEAALFASREIPQLASATLLIEMHEQFSPGVTESIRSRYAATHEITVYPALPDEAAAPVDLGFLSPDERQMAGREYRAADQQCWMLLVPKTARR